MFNHSVAHVLTLTRGRVNTGSTIGAALDDAIAGVAKDDEEFATRLLNACTGWLVGASLDIQREGHQPAAGTLVRRALADVQKTLP